MVTRINSGEPSRKRPAATTPEQRNNQMIDMAYDAAEKMIREGKATSQLLTHFLKQGTERERLERARIEKENILLAARTDALAATEDTKDLVERALAAFTEYQGGPAQHD